MKLLFLHCKKFWYSLDHATPIAEPTDISEASFEDVMVIFLAVEQQDIDLALNPVAKEVRKILRKSGAKRLLVNPFSHLSQRLAPHDVALSITHSLIERLKGTSDVDILYSSFGWYKQFLADVHGHDNSQIFREY